MAFLSLKSISSIRQQSQIMGAITFFVNCMTFAFNGAASPGLVHLMDSFLLNGSYYNTIVSFRDTIESKLLFLGQYNT